MAKQLTNLGVLAFLLGGCAASAESMTAGESPALGKGDYGDPISETSDRRDGGELALGTTLTAEDWPFQQWELALSGEAEVTFETHGAGTVADTMIWVFERQPDRSWSPEVVEGGFNDDDPRYVGEMGSFVKLTLGRGEYLLVVESFDPEWARPFVLKSSCEGPGCVLAGPSCQALEQGFSSCGADAQSCFGDAWEAARACCERYQLAWCY